MQNYKDPKQVTLTFNGGTLEKRFSDLERRAPSRLTLSALTRARSDNEPSTREAIRRSEAVELQESMKTGIETLKKMNCWTEISRLSNKNVLHSKFVLKRKRAHTAHIAEFKARLVAFGNEETDHDEESFSPVPDSSMIRLLMSIAKQRGSHARHYDVQNASTNEQLDRPVFVELPKLIAVIIIGGIIL